MTTVLLAGEHPLMLRGLRSLLAWEPELEVVGEARDGAAAIQAIEQLRPDVAIVDLMMPGRSGLEVTRECARRAPDTRIVILSVHDGDGPVVECLMAGARGYVLTECSDTDLMQAVQEVVAGGRYLSRTLYERAIGAYVERVVAGRREPGENLSPRERQVMGLAARGHTNGEIGLRLGISPRTAEAHRARLMRKLGLLTHADLVRHALQVGLLAPESQPPPVSGDPKDLEEI